MLSLAVTLRKNVRMPIRALKAACALGILSAFVSALSPLMAVAEPVADAHADCIAGTAACLLNLGQADLAIGDFLSAQDNLLAALVSIDDDDHQDLRAEILFSLGNAQVLGDQPEQAKERFLESAAAADQVNDLPTYFRAQLNLARLLIDRDDTEQIPEANTVLHELRSDFLRLPDSAWKAEQLVSLGELYHRADMQTGGTANAGNAISILDKAAAMARRHGDLRSESFAHGYLGSIAERYGDREKALAHTRMAVQKAQQAEALDGLYLWQWQTGRLLEQEPDDIDLAIVAYQQAIDTLESIRPLLARGSTRNFQTAVTPVFFGMANLLLNQHNRMAAGDTATANLEQVRTTIERFKVAEIQDYFDDQCLIGEEQQADLDQLAGDAAVIYPIIFEERLEVLTSYGGEIYRHTTPVRRADLATTVDEFRRELLDTDTQNYRNPGGQLYRWLVGDVADDLRKAGVTTLIFVPDGPLRTVPPAAFWDAGKQQFLIEQFAVANTLGLTLTSPRPIERESTHVLAAGISEARTIDDESFAALPAVPEELAAIQAEYPSTSTFLDEAFEVKPVSDALSEGGFAIVHIATHGEFRDNYRESFLLAYDEKITLDALEETIGRRRYLNDPVELLMLSACETAVGDDRAALGLAGIALKAGARSAVATLWPINDAATAQMVSDFYRQLKHQSLSKAEALQAAQKNMLTSDYAHPWFWSPYLLIGNWL
jgi:CHAT domain-containing protein